MPFGRANNSLALLEQEYTPPPQHAQIWQAPNLDVKWGSFHQGAASSLRALVSRLAAPKKFLSGEFFRDCWIEGRIPRRAVIAAGLWHVVFLAMPWPQLPASPQRNPALENFQLTWSGPINDLPLLKMSSPASVTAPGMESNKITTPANEGADAVHPRQHIFTDAVRPNHPRQTLINTAAPAVPPKILPSLPNIVVLQSQAAPAKPRVVINEQALAQFHPREARPAKVAAAPLPDVPNVERMPAEITMLASPNAPARPKLELNAGVAPRLTQQRMQNGDAGPPPDVEQSRQNSANASTLIAISAAPGPAMPRVPQGNLAARVSISPEGTQPGAPHGETARAAENKSGSGSTSDNHSASPGGGAGKDAATVSISGGNPPAKTGISGLGGNPQPKIDTSAARGFSTKIDPRVRIEDVQRTGPPNFAALPPGAKPEQVFASKKMYTLLVNMPNLNSATGSWILNFSELRSGPGQHVAATDLAGPVPVKKSDPKYPPTLINERVEGEVVLYAVIRADGSVDSVQLVRGIDEQLDANAMAALSQWKFRPASRQGEPVDLEAIVHIPFHLPAER